MRYFITLVLLALAIHIFWVGSLVVSQVNEDHNKLMESKLNVGDVANLKLDSSKIMILKKWVHNGKVYYKVRTQSGNICNYVDFELGE